MKPDHAFTILADAALESCATVEARTVVLDALSTIATKAGLRKWARRAAKVLAALRAAEAAQLGFEEILNAAPMIARGDGAKP